MTPTPETETPESLLALADEVLRTASMQPDQYELERAYEKAAELRARADALDLRMLEREQQLEDGLRWLLEGNPGDNRPEHFARAEEMERNADLCVCGASRGDHNASGDCPTADGRYSSGRKFTPAPTADLEETEEMHTPVEWNSVMSYGIVDFDGFGRNRELLTTRMTRQEFIDRAIHSTRKITPAQPREQGVITVGSRVRVNLVRSCYHGRVGEVFAVLSDHPPIVVSFDPQDSVDRDSFWSDELELLPDQPDAKAGQPYEICPSCNSRLAHRVDCPERSHPLERIHEIHDSAKNAGCSSVQPKQCPSCQRQHNEHEDWCPAQPKQGPTKGPWTLGTENNENADVVAGDTLISFDRCDGITGKIVIDRDEMLANVHFVIEASEVLAETGLTPRQLAEENARLTEQRDELAAKLAERSREFGEQCSQTLWARKQRDELLAACIDMEQYLSRHFAGDHEALCGDVDMAQSRAAIRRAGKETA